MLRGMTAAHDHAPFVIAEPQRIPIAEPLVRRGQRINHFAKRPEFSLVSFERLLVPARGAIKVDAVGGSAPSCIGGHQPAAQIFQSAHPEPRFESFRNPARHSAMIGMHVRDHHARDGSRVKSMRKRTLPGVDRVGRLEPRIDNRPTVPVGDGPDGRRLVAVADVTARDGDVLRVRRRRVQ